VAVRPLRAEDAERCDRIVASLSYHFGQEDGRGVGRALVDRLCRDLAAEGAGCCWS
jgi:hypothetical protein